MAPATLAPGGVTVLSWRTGIDPEPIKRPEVPMGSVLKKRRRKMRRHKHKKLLARTRAKRRKG